MKTLIILASLFISINGMSQNMDLYQEKTDSLIAEKQYAEALKRMEWWHEKVRNHDTSYVGDGLSFFLHTWAKVGTRDPTDIHVYTKS